ncbi:mannosyltransferase [Diplocarpon rosae]|nr:mannosyltransferase [Diplocarpon rosae]
MFFGHRPQERPIRSLVTLYVGWKALLLLVAACSPGPGYDTSASLVEPGQGPELPWALRYLVGKLTRWDAVYFVQLSTRGYLFEQEWAFGWGFTRLITACTTVFRSIGVTAYEGLEGLVAICIAHVSHLLSVLAVFSLTRALFPNASVNFAFTAAVLHIISPAGLFLSAPYAESACALMSFVGCMLFTKGLLDKGSNTASHDLLLLFSGICFGIATSFRSNGILNGTLLLEEACKALYDLRNGWQLPRVRRLIATGLGGMSVGAGFVLPQYIAYSEYCGGRDTVARPWCERGLPSIYTFVQDHYWDCGLFRYWKWTNLPLFLLAAPMFAILTVSGLWGLSFDADRQQEPTTTLKGNRKDHGTRQVLRNLAFSQLMLVIVTLTTAHVQIITRISSAYPLWLWYGSLISKERNTLLGGNLVQFMVIYALVQGALFASFLPPA